MIQDIPFKVIKGRLNDSAESAFTYYYEPIIRKSDTMDFSPNDDWKLLEPTTDIPRSIVQAVTAEPDKPLDQTARAVTVGSCAAIWVLLPFIVWLKISGR